jgi:hypothetical protein
VDPIARFMEYAAAFEDVYESDDWRLLEPYFSDTAVYELVGAESFVGRHEGRDAIFAALKTALDNFDRRFETRQLDFLQGPELREDAVWFHWRGSYKSPGLPELVIEGKERAWLEGDRIHRLVDDIPLEIGHISEYWFQHYGGQLG